MMELRKQIKNCQKCQLYQNMPSGCHPVPGIGPINAKLFIVGEALGADEALLEEPFVGMCGKFLTKCLADAGIKREDCYISNVVKCRPTDTGKKNRPPSAEEVSACIGWLWQELKIIKPKTVLTLGNFALKTLISDSLSITKIAGSLFERKVEPQFKIIPTYHPSWVQNYSKGKMKEFISHLKTTKAITWDSSETGN